MSTIERRFVTVHGRQVHYRVCGNGPALLLIHQSPQNSRMWRDMMARFADRYTVLAPDIAGFGYSDALPGDPQTIAEFGAAMFEWTEAIGLERFAAFGMHTGGLIATWLAWAHPEHVAALVVDGYAAFTPEESAMYGERYLPPFVPQWDGSHLRWLWARMREQKYFYPWYDGRAEAAMRIEPHTAEGTREAVMDVLDVGDTYRAGYAAAFRHNDHHWVRELRIPAWLVFRKEDPLRAYLSRLQGLPNNVTALEEAEGVAGMHRRMDGWLAETLAREKPYVLPQPSEPEAGWCRRIVPTCAGEIACWRHPGRGRLRILLHAPGTCPRDPRDLDTHGDAWLVPDLPGHGASSESDAPLDGDTVVAALLEAIRATASTGAVALEAHGAAAGYVPELVHALAERVREVVLHAPWLLDAAEREQLLANLPTTRVDRAGGYLCDAWHWERERHLLWPWMPPSAAARRCVDAPDPAIVHANVVELLRLGTRLESLLRGATVPGLFEKLASLPMPLHVQTDAESDYQGRATALAARCSEGPRS